MCTRIDDTVSVQLRDARHWGKPFDVYHFLISKLVTRVKSEGVSGVDNGLLVEVNGERVAHADFDAVQQRMMDARASDYVVLKFVPFALIRPYISAVPAPPPPVFKLVDVPHDGNCFFYAAQQSLQSGHAVVTPDRAAAQRTYLWTQFHAWWVKQQPAMRQKVLASVREDVSKQESWVTPFTPVTEYQVRVWSDVARVKVVVYTFYSKGSWLRVKTQKVLTLADLRETNRVNKMVVGAHFSHTIYLLHVSDREHGFEHYASLIPQPPS